MARHQLAIAAAFAVLAVECAAGLPPHAQDSGRPDAQHLAATSAIAATQQVGPRVGDPSTPAPAAAADPAPAPMASDAPAEDSSAPLPKSVEPVRPDVRIDGVPADAMSQLPELDGIREAVLVRTPKLKAATPDGLEPLRALVVDTQALRRFTPGVTANEVGVWERLQEGNIVPTAAAANKVKTELGGSLTLSGGAGSEALRVGALAANGLPQLADVMIPAEAADRLVDSTRRTLLLAVADGADVDAVTKRVQAVVGGKAERLVEPEREKVSTGQVGQTTLESFSYQSVGDGTIRIDPDWVSRNIVTTTLPILGRVTCHRVVIPQLSAALQDIQAAGLADQIYQFAGCWVPRHKMWDPSRSISNHAWGLAFDINVPTNQYGASPQMNRKIVEIFQRWGFSWGGDWSTPDGMHFELGRIVRS